jgi:tetratricopeptide (TPR) repeat protein
VLNGLGMSLTGLAQFQEAEHAFKRSLVTAERIGDLDAARNVWSNLGALYHDLGAFAKAAISYARALDCDQGSPSRISVDAYVNATLLAVDLGSLDKAEELLETADRCAAESRLWYDEVAAGLARGHYLLARAQPEQAWTFVEHAVALTGDKGFYLTDYGLYGRLLRHFVWATQGADAILRLSDTLRKTERGRVRIAHQMEIDCFNEWLAANGPAELQTRGTVERIRELRLYGRLSRVIAANVVPPGVPTPELGESSAALVARFFQLSDVLPAR